MSQKIQAPRGTYDVLPDAADARASLEATARRVLEGAGYRRIETPTFEHTELFSRGVGESTDIVQKEMYTFDDGGERSVTLRPEGTAPICRAYVEHGMHKLPQPVKLWYLSSFFRKEKPQAGRYRQFWQIGAEALGSDDPAVDAETILLLTNLLAELDVGGVRLRLGSLGTLAARSAYREELQAYLREQQISCPTRSARGSTSTRCARSTPTTRARANGHARGTAAARPPRRRRRRTLRRRQASCSTAPSVGYEVDPTLVRGMDYYTRTVFEFTSDGLGAQSGVAGGGRYDGLVQQFGGPPTPGCGWAAGLERILLASPDRPVAAPPVDLYVAYDAGRCARRRSRSSPRRSTRACTPSSSSPGARARASSSRPTGSAPGTLRCSATAGRS